ncbi:MerR family transcriptional regulator [Candidatus Dependentiae bacterium]|nr:MerR family transcriptional regulator [Candidatus Dependentiae bacterium]
MQNQKTNMKQKKFRIGELSEKLKIKKFVIRFWEKEFELKSDRSGGGQRFYTQDDLNTFNLIKELLYKKKFTIPGAKKELQTLKNKKLKPAISEKFEEPKNDIEIPKEFFIQLNKLKKQLLNLKEQL